MCVRVNECVESGSFNIHNYMWCVHSDDVRLNIAHIYKVLAHVDSLSRSVARVLTTQFLHCSRLVESQSYVVWYWYIYKYINVHCHRRGYYNAIRCSFVAAVAAAVITLLYE